MKYYDRGTKSYVEEIEYGAKGLNFLYGNVLGRIVLKTVAARPWFSNLMAIKKKSKSSKKDILPFVNTYQVDVTGYDLSQFNSFRDFFIRQRSYETNTKDHELMAVADSKLSVYIISDNLKLKIKNSIYEIKDIIEDEALAKEYAGGTCLVFRLAVSDYHRYVFFDDGQVLSHKNIKGELHTVRSISEKYKVYSRNQREVCVLRTKNFGDVCYIEVGAMLVGRINNHEREEFRRIDEKGFFDYGGSTIVLLIKEPVKMDEDILRNSEMQIETKVSIGEKIGERIYT